MLLASNYHLPEGAVSHQSPIIITLRRLNSLA
ncbi:hypothetical protein P3T18_001198 [Paraburkholderia sp. GAS199]